MTSVPFTAIPPPTPQPSDLAAAPNPAGSDGPLVSIIIRSMGRPSLVEALASLAGQTYRRLEAVVVDATGVWLSMRRLHAGRFHWLRGGEAVCTLSAEQFDWLCAGVDWMRLSANEVPNAVV